MNDLTILFPPDDRSSRDGDDSEAQAENLRRLVGAPQRRAAASANSSPADLSLLVGERAPSARSTAPDLSSLVGARPAPAVERSPIDLSSLVGTESKKPAERGWSAPELAQAGRRPLFGGRRKAGSVNMLSIAAAVLAVAALAGTATFAVVQRATANPADEAMVSLREREAELQNETNILRTAADLYVASVSDAKALGEASAGALSGLRGRVDTPPLDTAETSRTALLAAAAAAPPSTVPEYSRDDLDEKSLADVGKALDAVRLAREALPALVTDVREDRAVVVAALEDFRGELRNLGEVIEVEAAKQTALHDAAADTFRSAVSDAAARVRSAQAAGGDGLSDMSAYAAALDALRAENERVVALRAAEAEDAPVRTPQRTPPSRGGSQPSPEPSPSPTAEPSPEPPTEPSQEPSKPAESSETPEPGTGESDGSSGG